MPTVTTTILVLLDVTVHIDALVRLDGSLAVGFGYHIGDRSYTAGGYDTVAAATRAARGHVRRTLADRERARAAGERRMRELRTIGSWGSV